MFDYIKHGWSKVAFATEWMVEHPLEETGDAFLKDKSYRLLYYGA